MTPGDVPSLRIVVGVLVKEGVNWEGYSGVGVGKERMSGHSVDLYLLGRFGVEVRTRSVVTPLFTTNFDGMEPR